MGELKVNGYEHRATVMNYHNGDRYEGEIFRNLRDG